MEGADTLPNRYLQRTEKRREGGVERERGRVFINKEGILG